MDVSVLATMVAVSLACALAANLFLAPMRRPRFGRSVLLDDADGGTVFLFDEDTLVDATKAGRALLAASRVRGTPWQRLLDFAKPRFAGVEEAIAALPDRGQIALHGNGADALTLTGEWRGGLRRITLVDGQMAPLAPLVDPFVQRAQDAELQILRQVTDLAPFPIWREGGEGAITWANQAYVHLAGIVSDATGAPPWPLPLVFPTAQDAAPRLRLALPGSDAVEWFDKVALPDADGQVLFALPAGGAVQTEQTLREFVQTLTKTFAHLPIGLAIFDRQRKLQLFNPALTDLAALPVDFLAGRPTLFAFLDAMRDRRMIPEPKDYKTWRAQMAALESAAAAGQYEETWSLASGVTYRVTGRPHPEGALALMIEDISDEVSRTRTYRADLALGQSVIDAMEEAVAVFSSAGVLVLSNAAYAELWDSDPGAVVAETGVAAAVQHWQSRCAIDPIWSEAEAFLSSDGDRTRWDAGARMRDGRALRCRFVPVAGGATLVAFAVVAAAEPLRTTSRRSETSRRA